jgi:polyferredoxin
MNPEPDDQPPPLPQFTLRGLLLFNTVIGLFASFLTTLGMGDIWLGLMVTWSVLGVLFLIQWGTLWLVMQFFKQPDDERHAWRDPRNAFPKLPRDRQ